MKLGSSSDLLLPAHQPFMFRQALGNRSCVAKPQGRGECRKRRSGFLSTSCIHAVEHERLVLLNLIVPMLQRCLLGKQRWSITAIQLRKKH